MSLTVGHSFSTPSFGSSSASLGKNFNSSRLFQRNWSNSDPVPSRVWTIDHSDSSQQRVAQVHALLAGKKPYSHHLKLAKQHANEIKDAYTAHARDLKERTSLVEQQLEKDAVANRARLRRALSEHVTVCDNRQAAMKQQLKELEQDYKEARDDMQKRVSKLPKVWGATRPPPKPEDVQNRKAEPAEAMRDRHVAYNKMLAAIQQELGKRPGPPGPGKPDKQAAAQRAEAAKDVRQVSSQYEEFLESIHKRHSQRVRTKYRETREWHQALPAWEAPLHPVKQLTGANEEMQGRLDAIATRRRRLGALGGYTPVKKSTRRLREAAADECAM